MNYVMMKFLRHPIPVLSKIVKFLEFWYSLYGPKVKPQAAENYIYIVFYSYINISNAHLPV